MFNLFNLFKKKRDSKKRSSKHNSKHGTKKCWEFKNCGCEKSGNSAKNAGVCPAYPNHGRQCWNVTGTLCNNMVQGSFVTKKVHCFDCDFFLFVQKEEGKDFVISKNDKESEKNIIHEIINPSSNIESFKKIGIKKIEN